MTLVIDASMALAWVFERQLPSDAERASRLLAAGLGQIYLDLWQLIDKANHQLGWQPRWPFATTVQRTVGWYQAVHEGISPMDCCMSDLELYGVTLATLRNSTNGASGTF